MYISDARFVVKHPLFGRRRHDNAKRAWICVLSPVTSMESENFPPLLFYLYFFESLNLDQKLCRGGIVPFLRATRTVVLTPALPCVSFPSRPLLEENGSGLCRTTAHTFSHQLCALNREEITLPLSLELERSAIKPCLTLCLSLIKEKVINFIILSLEMHLRNCRPTGNSNLQNY